MSVRPTVRKVHHPPHLELRSHDETSPRLGKLPASRAPAAAQTSSCRNAPNCGIVPIIFFHSFISSSAFEILYPCQFTPYYRLAFRFLFLFVQWDHYGYINCVHYPVRPEPCLRLPGAHVLWDGGPPNPVAACSELTTSPSPPTKRDTHPGIQFTLTQLILFSNSYLHRYITFAQRCPVILTF